MGVARIFSGGGNTFSVNSEKTFKIDFKTFQQTFDETRNLKKASEKIVETFQKFSKVNCEKTIILPYCSNEVNKPWVNRCSETQILGRF